MIPRPSHPRGFSLPGVDAEPSPSIVGLSRLVLDPPSPPLLSSPPTHPPTYLRSRLLQLVGFRIQSSYTLELGRWKRHRHPEYDSISTSSFPPRCGFRNFLLALAFPPRSPCRKRPSPVHT